VWSPEGITVRTGLLGSTFVETGAAGAAPERRDEDQAVGSLGAASRKDDDVDVDDYVDD
jgi:hypothetical protein